MIDNIDLKRLITPTGTLPKYGEAKRPYKIIKRRLDKELSVILDPTFAPTYKGKGR